MNNHDVTELCRFLSGRLRAERNRLNHSQRSMSDLCGVSLRTYKRIELSGKGSIENLIRILVATDRVKAIDLLFPQHNIKRNNVVDRISELARTVRDRNY